MCGGGGRERGGGHPTFEMAILCRFLPILRNLNLEYRYIGHSCADIKLILINSPGESHEKT